MANVNIELGYKNLAWFDANPTIVLLEGQIVFLEQTGNYKIGNGTSQLSALSFLGISAETQTLQNVTDLGNVTTNDIEANAFVKTGGTSNEFLKADGSVDTTSYLYEQVVPIGGTTGQILAKVDDTSYNLEWIENYANYTSVLKHTVKASQSLTKGQAVYVNSATGTNMIVSKASNVSEATSSKTMGLIAQDLATNGIGFVITEGLLSNINTSTATIGDPVWLGVNGDLIYGLASKPYAPAHLVFIGIVTRVSATVGEIFVKVQNGFELREIHDVDLISNLPNNNEVLTFESSTNLWKPKTVISALGYTPYNSTNPSGYISGITSGMVTTALGFTPYNSTNPSGYITGITSGMITTALGFTPYNATNPSGYITSSALTPYAPLSNPTFTTAITTPLINGVSGLLQFKSTDKLNIGNASSTNQLALRVGQGTAFMDFGAWTDTSYLALYANQTTPGASNYFLLANTSLTRLNGNNQLDFASANAVQFSINRTAPGITYAFTPSNMSGNTASTELPVLKMSGAIKTFNAGALALQRFNYFAGQTLAFASASTATDVYNAYFEVTTAGTNATITKNYAAGFGGDIKVSGNVNTYIDGGYNLYNAAGNQFIGSILRGSDASLLIEAAMVNLKLGAGGSAGDVLIYTSNTAKSIRLSSTIGTYIGSNLTTAPSAKLHLGAGTATAGTAPLKLSSGTNLTTPENGAFEYDGTNLYFTTGGVRKMVTLI